MNMMPHLAMFSVCTLLFRIFCWAQCPSADMTGDCYVDVSDLAQIAGQWLTGYRLPPDMVWISGGTFQMGNSTDAGEGMPNELPVHTEALDSFAMGKYEITNGQYCAFLNWLFLRGLITVMDGVVYQSESEMNVPYCRTRISREDSLIDFSQRGFMVRTKGGRDMSKDPMVYVSWNGAVAYCNWRSQREGRPTCYNLLTWSCHFTKKDYRLPTEAEWEYAARGGLSGQRFPWGMEISQLLANYWSEWSGGKPVYPYDVNSGYHPFWNDGNFPHTSPVGSFPPRKGCSG
jgi:formylglycine-generating enzyme required for sulfatase activity